MEDQGEDFPNFLVGLESHLTQQQTLCNNEAQPDRERFATLSETEMQQILAEKHSSNPKASTNWALRTFKSNHFTIYRHFILL